MGDQANCSGLLFSASYTETESKSLYENAKSTAISKSTCTSLSCPYIHAWLDIRGRERGEPKGCKFEAAGAA